MGRPARRCSSPCLWGCRMGNNALLQAALDYAARGWAVLPLCPGGKNPRIPKEEGGRGFYDATSDAAQIRSWWARWPNANLGVALRASGLVLVDVDHKNGTKPGLETLARAAR